MNISEIKPGLWLLDVRIVKGGKQYRKRQRIQSGKKEAVARFHEIRRELKERAKEESCSLTLTTFKDIIDFYLERNVIDRCSESYFRRLKDDLGDVRVEDLQARFDRYLLFLRHSKGKLTRRPFANNTINRILSWAKAAVNCALVAGRIEKNPLQHFQKLPVQPRSRMLTEEEKERLLDTARAEAPHIFPILLFSMLVPSRRGELATLKRTDYDMVNNCIVIPGERTKNGRPCIKPVPECLKEYMRSVPVESEYLFYRRDWRGKYLPLGDFHKSYKRCLRKAGIENFRFHDLRRVAYTDLLLAGNPPHVVMQVSGHLTDMSKVYFGRNELLAAKMIKIVEKPYTSPVHLKAVAV
jgi:integrase